MRAHHSLIVAKTGKLDDYTESKIVSYLEDPQAIDLIILTMLQKSQVSYIQAALSLLLSCYDLQLC